MNQDRDRNVPNPAASKSKAEGERWQSESDTVERRERESTFAGDSSDEAGGISNRPLDEETENQEAVPDRGKSRSGAHAGHGNRKEER